LSVRTLASALLLFAAGAAAQDRLLGEFDAWTAFTYVENGESVCMMWSQPQKAEGEYTRRGEIYAFVSHRPPRRDEIRFEAGYPFAAGSRLTLTIGGDRFTLATRASTAWLDDSALAPRLIRTMQAGETMIVEGTSSRGTRTRDTYSLLGFTAAHRAISAACGLG